MNTTNILLGTTSVLLVVAFALSFGDFKKSSKSDDAISRRQEKTMELERVRQERLALELELMRNRAALTPSPLPAYPTPSPVTPAPSAAQPQVSASEAARIAELDAELEAIRQANETLENEKDEANQARLDAEEKAQLAEGELASNYEEKLALKEQLQIRTKKINLALSMGTVTSANKEIALVIFEPTENANFDIGKVMSIRRNGGIVGEITVDRLDSAQGLYIGTMRAHGFSADGYPDVLPGDEVIHRHVIDPAR